MLCLSMLFLSFLLEYPTRFVFDNILCVAYVMARGRRWEPSDAIVAYRICMVLYNTYGSIRILTVPISGIAIEFKRIVV